MPFVHVCVLLCKHVLQEAAARTIEEARAEVGEVTGDSDDDTAPPNGFNDILNEVCKEAGYESDESDKGAW